MRIDEIGDREQINLQFDLVDDTLAYMRNDPIFYRKVYYPAVIAAADKVNDGHFQASKDILVPVIKKGINMYCKKFDITPTPDKLYTNEDHNDILNRIFSDELVAMKNKDY